MSVSQNQSFFNPCASAFRDMTPAQLCLEVWNACPDSTATQHAELCNNSHCASPAWCRGIKHGLSMMAGGRLGCHVRSLCKQSRLSNNMAPRTSSPERPVQPPPAIASCHGVSSVVSVLHAQDLQADICSADGAAVEWIIAADR